MSDLEDFIANFKPQTGTNKLEEDDMDIITHSNRSQRSDGQRRATSARRLGALDPDDLDPQAIYRRRSAARQGWQRNAQANADQD
ncbi:hypothetical protein ACFQZO_24400 [Bradyrhizobium sp. GCM10027634]|uniref:hypothetical protein n=1 Tax=unclassified Bradyrhizobium TaxID=2631580 RepID=UPI00263B0D39|nr:hypothetical protein [Bradyrhizobium sp. WYCCWR 12677]MDN5003983.1 hypothetical protein [Bradyrhizobium sp. WYCCWR 12677]